MKSAPSLYVVLQNGGSATEHYFHSFLREQDANSFIRSAERASYECYGPEEIQLPEIADLMFSVRNLLQDLPEQVSRNSAAVANVEKALATMEKNLLVS
jgi:hypothetical protein